MKGTLGDLEHLVTLHRRALEEYKLTLAKAQRGLEANAIADMLVSLLNPLDTTYRHVWIQAIRDFNVIVTSVSVAGSPGTRVSFTFTLLLSDDHTTVALPAHGDHFVGALNLRDQQARWMFEQLRSGTPLNWESENNTSRQRQVFRYLREEVLALDDGRGAFLQCRVPELLRVGVPVLFPEEATVENALDRLVADDECVEIFTRPDVLGGRINDVYPGLSSRSGWMVRTSIAAVHALTIAARNNGHVRAGDFDSEKLWWAFYGLFQKPRRRHPIFAEQDAVWNRISMRQFQLLPCPHCGGIDLALMAFRDPCGPVCLACRCDQAGVTWPAELFDPYVREPQLWNALGYHLPVATAEHYASRRWRRARNVTIAPAAARPPEASLTMGAATGSLRGRRVSALTQSELDDAVRAYLAPGSIREVAARFDIRKADLSTHLQHLGVRRDSRPGKPKTGAPSE